MCKIAEMTSVFENSLLRFDNTIFLRRVEEFAFAIIYNIPLMFYIVYGYYILYYIFLFVVYIKYTPLFPPEDGE